MQYIQELLNAKRLPIKNILESPCTITVKVDGSAFQVAYDSENQNIKFGKRSYDATKLTKPINAVDLFINTTYFYAYSHLTQYINIIKEYDILNFEVLSKHEKHIIDYKYKDDYTLVLISAYKNGNIITSKELIYLAKSISCQCINFLEVAALPDRLINVLLTSSTDEQTVYSLFTDVYNVNDKDKIEGLVVDFYYDNKHRLYKVQNPKFLGQLRTHLSDELYNKQNINVEHIYTKLIKYIQEHKLSNNGKTKFERLFYFWYDVKSLSTNDIIKEINNISVIKNMKLSEKFLKNFFPILYNLYINTTENEKFLLKFIFLGFQNVRVKTALWCSNTYQKDVLNPFLTNILFKDINLN